MNTTVYDMTESFQRGEEKGFTFFYNSLYSALCFYAFKFLQDKDEAKDHVDEAFIKIWDRHKSFSHHHVIKSWLYTTVRNSCLNYLQQSTRRKNILDNMAAEMTQEVDPVSRYMIEAEVYSELYNLFKKLPTECRKVFNGLYIDGFDTTLELSKHLGVAWTTTKNQKMRGLEILRKHLKKFTDREERAIQSALDYCARTIEPKPTPAPKKRKKRVIIPEEVKKRPAPVAIKPGVKVPALWRKAYNLKDKLTTKEIGRRLGLKPHTVSMYIHYYKKALAS